MYEQRILAQAVCDLGAFEVADRVRDLPWLVSVTGCLESGDALASRIYEIAAESEAQAGMAGLDRYVREMVKIN